MNFDVRLRGVCRAVVVVAVGGPLAALGTAQDRADPDGAEARIEGLRDRDVQARRSAAAAIRSSDRSVQRDALPALIELLMTEKDGQVRLAVFDAVTALGHDAAQAVPALVHTLRTDYGGQGKEETHQDYRAALALAAVGEPAVEGLRGLLGGSKEGVRAEAAMGLGRIGPDAGAAVADLILILGDQSERVRREASVALGRIGTIAVEPLITASGHQDAVVRAGAVQSLGHVSPPGEQVRRAVLAATHDAAPEVRAAAVRSLSGLALPDEALLPAPGRTSP
ncbi:MAG: HEAT repeat domain-containing protein [Singulisphaera sp.]